VNHEQRLLRHATRMAIVTFLSRAAGYVRDKALAWVLGAEALNDAFRTAFRIPNAFRALLAEGALHAAFVPALARLSDDGDSGREARELVRGLTAALLLATSVVVGLGIALSPWLVRLYAPGFVGDSATFDATVLMNRLMFPYLGLVSLAALLQGVLNSRERFLLPAATPIVFNLALAAGAWWLSRGGGPAPVVLSLAVLVGGALQFLVQLPAVRSLGFRVHPLWRALRSPAVTSVLLLMLPGIAVLGLNQVNQFVTNRFASTLGEGAITIQFYAYRVTELMYGGIVVQLTTVLLPVMSRQLRQEPAAASVTLLDTVRLVSFITLPTATVLAVAARPVIGLLFGGGRFDAEAVAVTGTTLAAYAFGLVALGHAKVVASAFFAQQNTRTPMVGSALSLGVFIVACALLAGPLGVPGLGLANTVAMTAYAALLTAAYARRYGLHGARVGPTLVAVGRQLAASAAVGWGLWLALPWLAGIERTGAGEALRVLAVLGPVAATYVLLVVLFGGREPAALLAALRGRGRS
jgi:putative peptidoglycan lipid II flippase